MISLPASRSGVAYSSATVYSAYFVVLAKVVQDSLFLQGCLESNGVERVGIAHHGIVVFGRPNQSVTLNEAMTLFCSEFMRCWMGGSS